MNTDRRSGRARFFILGFVCATSTLIGCTSPPVHEQTPASQTLAPDIAQPLDVTTFQADPCKVMDDAGLRTINFVSDDRFHKAGKGQLGPECSWRDISTQSHLGVIWRNDLPSGLADLYTKRKQFAYFEETSIQEYPAVFAAPKDQRSAGSCVLTIGFNARDALQVQIVTVGSDTPPTQACDYAAQAAHSMLAIITSGK